MNNGLLDVNQGFAVDVREKLDLSWKGLSTIGKEIILIKYPEKLIIEPSTRCNFNCKMCVKQSSG